MVWVSTAGFFALMVLACAGGWRLQAILPEHHRSRETLESVRLVIGMLLTFAALVLGLLTSSAKSRYDASVSALDSFATDLTLLDLRLRQYGPQADPVRTMLRAYTAAVIASTWPGEARPSGQYPLLARPSGMLDKENASLGDMLTAMDDLVERFSPTDPLQQRLAELARQQMTVTLDERWRLVGRRAQTLSWPFLSVLMIWLMIVFAMFGLSSPRNALLRISVALTALSIALALYLILDFDAPLTGLLKVPSQPLREALAHMDHPG